MGHEAFISYAEPDRAAAVTVCKALEEAGVECWIAPRDAPAGREWGEAIIEAIATCRVMVLVFSAKANQSSHVRREVERAVQGYRRPYCPA